MKGVAGTLGPTYAEEGAFLKLETSWYGLRLSSCWARRCCDVEADVVIQGFRLVPVVSVHDLDCYVPKYSLKMFAVSLFDLAYNRPLRPR